LFEAKNGRAYFFEAKWSELRRSDTERIFAELERKSSLVKLKAEKFGWASLQGVWKTRKS